MTQSALDIARELVRFPSLNPPGDEAECIAYVARRLEAAGFCVESYEFAPGRPSLVARLSGTKDLPPLAFTGHVDVVPLGSAQWRHPPFDAVLEDGILHGRGSCDMKSGIAAFISAAERLRAEAAEFRRGLVFVITSGEETGCQGAFDLARRDVLGAAELLIVAEPTSNRPVIAHKGSLRVRVTAAGKTAHSSMPEEGDNAISRAVSWVAKLEGHAFGGNHPLLGRTTCVVTTFSGGQNINSVPDSAQFTVDFRTLPGDDHGAMIATMQDLFGGNAQIEVVTDFPGFATVPESPTIVPLLEILQGRTGAVPELLGQPYFTDASALVPGFGNLPTVVIGPGASDQCHKTDEHCPVADIEAATELYEDLMRRMCL